MGTNSKENDKSGEMTIGFRTTEETNQALMQAIREAQAEGTISVTASKSDVLRMLVNEFIENPEILKDLKNDE